MSTERDTTEFTIDELATESGVASGTIRYYQSLRLLPRPRLKGRQGFYTAGHLRRLRRIRRLQDRGFSLAAIREILDTHDAGGSIASLVTARRSREEGDSDIQALIEEIFPEEGADAGPIQTAVALGVLQREDGRITVTDQAFRPMVIAILHLFQLGVPTAKALETWGIVQEHVQALATMFAELAREHVYSESPRSEHAGAFVALARAADDLVSFALFRAIADEFEADPIPGWTQLNSLPDVDP